jgi:hypothetical protein
VVELLGPGGPKLLDRLPFKDGNRTLHVVGQFDLISVRGCYIARAF